MKRIFKEGDVVFICRTNIITQKYEVFKMTVTLQSGQLMSYVKEGRLVFWDASQGYILPIDVTERAGWGNTEKEAIINAATRILDKELGHLISHLNIEIEVI